MASLLVGGCLSIAGIHVVFAAVPATYLASNPSNAHGALTELGGNYAATTQVPSGGTTCILPVPTSPPTQPNPEPYVYFLGGSTNAGSDTLQIPNCAAQKIYKQTAAGYTLLSAGDIQAGNTYTVRYSTVIGVTGTVGGFILYTYPTLSVLNYGAQPIETVTGPPPDSTASFQAALSTNLTNVTILVPPGTYSFKPNDLQSPPCCATNSAAVLVSNQSNFTIEGYGATIQANISPILQPGTAIMFNEDHDFSVKGLTIQAGWGAQPGNPLHNTGISIFSSWGFGFADLHFTGDYYAPDAAFSGDWMVNGKFENITMDAVGICTDFAFLQNVTFKNIQATGIGSNGGAGQKCFSIIVDPPNYSPSASPPINSNNTPVSSAVLSYSNHINIENASVTNFITGADIESGTNIYFSRNYWFLNPGTTSGSGPYASIPGYPILIYYNCPGSTCPSKGMPPSNITVDGDTFENNSQICCAPGAGGTSVSSGIYISSGGINNCGGCGDYVDNVIVKNSSFANNTGFAIETNSSKYTRNPSLFGNVISAESHALSYLPIGPNLLLVSPRIVKGNTIITVFDNLPSCTTASSPSVSYLVTDAATPTYGGALVGGGIASVLAFCNGSSWVTR